MTVFCKKHMILTELKTFIVLEGVTYPQGAVAPDFLFI